MDSQLSVHNAVKYVTRLKPDYNSRRLPRFEDYEKVKYINTLNRYKVMEIISMDTALEVVKLRNSLTG